MGSYKFVAKQVFAFGIASLCTCVLVEAKEIQSKPPGTKSNAAVETAKAKIAARMFVAGTKGTMFKRLDPTTISLIKGDVLVSVKSPFTAATVKTNFGSITIPVHSVVFVSLKNGQLSVQHLHGDTGSVLTTTLKQGMTGDINGPVSIASGQHLAVTAIPPPPDPTKPVTNAKPFVNANVGILTPANLTLTGKTIGQMGNALTVPSRKRLWQMAKTPLIDDFVDDNDFGFKDNADSDTTNDATALENTPSVSISPADSFQQARENPQQQEFASDDSVDDSGLPGLQAEYETGPDMDASGTMLGPEDNE